MGKMKYVFCCIMLALCALTVDVYYKIKKMNTVVDMMNVSHIISLSQAETLTGEMFREYAGKKIEALKRGVDARSSEVLDYMLNCMEYMKFLRKATFESVSVSLPNYQLAHQQNWDREKKIIKKKYDLCGEWHCPEIFYFHHGLRFTNKRVLDYVRGRDMIDCGAFIGDSLLIMREYTDKTVYCYEFSKKNIEKFFKVIKNNNITSGFALISKALGESVRRINYYEPGVVSSGISLTTGGDATVEMTTVDAEVKKHNITVGFIKIDVEGYGMPVIRGAIETIKSQRPVLSIGVYHNHEELFHIKPFLQENLTDYVFEFHLQQFTAGDFNELILLCYPKELASND